MATLIFANSRQLVRLVQDMMDFARLGRGEVHVQPEPYDLVPQLRGAALRLRPAEWRGSACAGDLPPALPVYADGARVEQIVSNLLDNALKYAPEGPITLRARPLPGEHGEGGAGGGAGRGPGHPPARSSPGCGRSSTAAAASPA